MSGSGGKDDQKLLKMAQSVKDSSDQQLEILTEWSKTKDNKKKKQSLGKMFMKELEKGKKLQDQINKAAKDMDEDE